MTVLGRILCWRPAVNSGLPADLWQSLTETKSSRGDIEHHDHHCVRMILSLSLRGGYRHQATPDFARNFECFAPLNCALGSLPVNVCKTSVQPILCLLECAVCRLPTCTVCRSLNNPLLRVRYVSQCDVTRTRTLFGRQQVVPFQSSQRDVLQPDAKTTPVKNF